MTASSAAANNFFAFLAELGDLESFETMLYFWRWRKMTRNGGQPTVFFFYKNLYFFLKIPKLWVITDHTNLKRLCSNIFKRTGEALKL